MQILLMLCKCSCQPKAVTVCPFEKYVPESHISHLISPMPLNNTHKKSSLNTQPPSTPLHPKPTITHRRNQWRDTSKDPKTTPIQRVNLSQDRTTPRSTSQDSKSNNTKPHPNPRPNLRLILRQRHEADWRHRNKDPAEEPAEYSDRHDPAYALHG